HMVPGLPCVIVGGYGLGIVMVDISNPDAPVAQPVFHPKFGASLLRNARVSDVGSDGRFLVASAPLPDADGTGSAYFWDFGPTPQCKVILDAGGNTVYPTFLGNVPPTDTLFNSNGGSEVDAARHVFY